MHLSTATSSTRTPGSTCACLLRYNLLREESEGWAKAVDVLYQKQPCELAPEALQHMVRLTAGRPAS